ncbi:glucose 1-dehydrogenase [Reichenbachiella carrageenanivorans]|uniref:Glucose 1-dehydrogenase n=1 Tax=Reichenbachiella carrageenanivorans TaxID=2979869 RepID=A0ABY6D418_9BACT|nr:glucose 1-dehydrogenase [Reichenbachiella carrageenanivorans]UXX79863.1 glucose 1-dehydrogenase [Reichenbachiella carrageenanivorans]
MEKRSVTMIQKFNLSGKTALVTGGGSGIGEAISKTLAQQGAKVVIADLSLQAAQRVADEISDAEGSAVAVACNVADEDQVKNTFQEIAKENGLDILVNNAGIAHVGSISKTSSEEFDRILDVNVKGVFHCSKIAVELMKMKGGVIVNLSSIAAHVGLTDRFAYSMSKGAVHAMTMSVAKDFLAHNIRCNSISPGRVHTPFVDGFLAKNYPGNEKEMFDTLSKSQPIGRMGNPDEIGALVLYLCSDEASFITGSDFPIDGGFVTLNT